MSLKYLKIIQNGQKNNFMLVVFLIYLVIGMLIISVMMENAPLYKDGKFHYKEWYTIFGIKVKRNKK